MFFQGFGLQGGYTFYPPKKLGYIQFGSKIQGNSRPGHSRVLCPETVRQVSATSTTTPVWTVRRFPAGISPAGHPRTAVIRSASSWSKRIPISEFVGGIQFLRLSEAIGDRVALEKDFHWD